MSENTKQKGLFVGIVVSALILVAAVIWAGMKRAESQEAAIHEHHEHENVLVEKDQGSSQTSENPAELPQMTIKQIEEMAKRSWSWGAYYNDWFGKEAPDFTLADLNGKEHKLSDYKGKEVMLVFWATWCGPCKMEIPHIIELRKSISEDKLAILAISNESEEVVKNFVQNNNLNYTVLVSKSTLSEPYSLVTGIPSSFFINSEGKIKFGTMGTIDLNVMKAIVEASE
jgi:peroxiredoxin